MHWVHLLSASCGFNSRREHRFFATMIVKFPSDSRLPDEVSGRIDHYSFASDDIESDYAYCAKNGYKIVTDGIEGIAGFWDNGIRYFKIASPTGEQFEFCQIL